MGAFSGILRPLSVRSAPSSTKRRTSTRASPRPKKASLPICRHCQKRWVEPIREGAVMAWYEIINAKSDSSIADRDAEALLHHVAMALQAADGPVDVDVFYGLTAHGARRYSLPAYRGRQS